MVVARTEVAAAVELGPVDAMLVWAVALAVVRPPAAAVAVAVTAAATVVAATATRAALALARADTVVASRLLPAVEVPAGGRRDVCAQSVVLCA